DTPATPAGVSDGSVAPVADLAALLRGRRTAVLSGAGLCPQAGIPDYRGGVRPGPPPPPDTYQQFAPHAHRRRRHTARSPLGWAALRSRHPNAGHTAVARLENDGHVTGVITQNVDGLHLAAGSHRVVELHGSLARVVCLNCGTREDRAALQARLEMLNPGFG